MASFEFHGLSIEPVDDRLVRLGSAVDCVEFDFTDIFISGDRVLVAGGGTGGVALYTAIRVGSSNVVVVEANVDLVRRMLQGVRFGGAKPHMLYGVLDTKGDLDWLDRNGPPLKTNRTFYVSPHHVLGSSIHEVPDGEPREVPCLDINQVIERYRINALSLDVEGAEYGLIHYVDLDRIRAIMMEIHGDQDQCDELVAHCVQRGFRTTRFHTQWPNYGLHVIGLERE